MTDPVNSILINEADDVATTTVALIRGDVGRYWAQGVIVEIVITEAIPQYHKFAVRDIRQDERVRKYGEVIGQAIRNIDKGAHVHVHNMASPRR